jgi:hypothetical protein
MAISENGDMILQDAAEAPIPVWIEPAQRSMATGDPSMAG